MMSVHNFKVCAYCSLSLGTSYFYTCQKCRTPYCFSHKDVHNCPIVDPPNLKGTANTVHNFLTCHPNEWFTLEELSEAIKLKLSSIQTILSDVMIDVRVVRGKRPGEAVPQSKTSWVGKEATRSIDEYTFIPTLRNRKRPCMMLRVGD